MKIHKLLTFSVISLGLSIITNPVFSATIGLFNNPQYITQTPSTNLINILESFGHQVNQFTSFETGAWQQIAAQNQLIFIPDQGEEILSQLSLETQNLIRNYITTGGGLISAGNFETALPFLNGLFGWSIEEDFTNRPFPLNITNATGTVFESAPLTIRPAFPTTPASIASLPSGAKSIYDNEENSTALFVNSVGLGQVAYISFGYGDVDREPNWGTVTDLTVEYVAKQETTIPIPEPSLVIGLLSFLGGALKLKLS